MDDQPGSDKKTRSGQKDASTRRAPVPPRPLPSTGNTRDSDSEGGSADDQLRRGAESALNSIRKTEEKISGLFDRLSNATGKALRIARKTTDTSYKVGKALIVSQEQLKKMSAAGKSLKDLREVAGLTVNELNEALKLKDRSLLEAVENGTAVLSFDLILRLSALLARNDPIPFILKYSRTYAPDTWRILNDWGAGRIPTQYQREREFINILRARDDARELTDAGFSKVLEFTRHAFDLSLHFVAEQEAELAALEQRIAQDGKRIAELEAAVKLLHDAAAEKANREAATRGDDPGAETDRQDATQVTAPSQPNRD
jgi:transcriptional regulator with XRE-family HTH domain